MKITAIEKNKGSRYTIYVDDDYWYILDYELIVMNGLRVGLECDEAFLEDLRDQAERRKARERAFYLLEYRDHTRKELVDKLVKSVSPEIAEQTADRMEELGYLDDRKYAKKYAAVLLEQKKLSKRAALYKMQQKGIDRALAEEIFADMDIDPREQIRELIEQKYERYLVDRKGLQKTVSALMRLGYNYYDVKDVVREYYEEE
ncbi:MAG: regulatory protein RecX [Clostridiales bacterium]|nr:regulatory protein RecX [Clostridiales bacterium]